MGEIERGLVGRNGTKVYYEMMGGGDPLVLIHGGYMDRRMWDDQLVVFAQDYRVIRYDVRGFGKSELPQVPYADRQDLAALQKSRQNARLRSRDGRNADSLFGAGVEPAFPLFSSCASIIECRLRHSGSPERDGSPYGTFPTERSGSRQERRAWVKRSRSIKNASCSACWARTGPLSEAPESSDSDVSCVEIKAVQARCCTEVRWSTDTSSSPFRGLRI